MGQFISGHCFRPGKKSGGTARRFISGNCLPWEKISGADGRSRTPETGSRTLETVWAVIVNAVIVSAAMKEKPGVIAGRFSTLSPV